MVCTKSGFLLLNMARKIAETDQKILILPALESIDSAIIHYRHSQYSPEKAFMHSLLLAMDEKRILLAVFEKQSRELLLLKEKNCAIETLQQTDILALSRELDGIEELGQNFAQTAVLIEHGRHSLVPQVFFAEDKIYQLYKNSNHIENSEDLLYNRVNTANAVNIFPMNRYINTLFSSRLKGPTFIHQGSALAEGLLKKGEDGMFIHFAAKHISITLIRRGQLQFLNSFPAETENDALYFILASLEEFATPGDYSVKLSGMIDENTVMHQLLKKYVKEISFLHLHEQLPRSHRYFTLLSAIHCE